MANIKHGFKKHLLYGVWGDMKDRCHNPNNKRYKDYGNRGITVCDEWKDNPKSFIEWALAHGWEKGLCIDRRDNNKGYSQDNCRFIDKGLNAKNARLLPSHNTSGYRGVSFYKQSKKYRTQIKINRINKYLGLFETPIKAAIAYDSMAVVLDDGRPTNFKWPDRVLPTRVIRDLK